LPPIPVAIGRYRVERLLGRGAMGMIYLAHDPAIDREVAIKLIRADLLGGEERADYVARFQHEAQAAGRCAHPNIVAVYDFALHEGNPYLAMEYVEGSNLSQVLARSGRFSPPAAVALIGQVLDALACAHGLGIVHRDVKPANILLLSDQRVKMTDFGISRLDTSGLTQTGSVIGTPSYMSPEQCRGEPADARSDLFCAGVVLYEVLSAARPFTGRNMTEIALQVMDQPPPDIRVIVPGLTPALVAVIERALAKRPADRFATASEMAASLRQSLASEPEGAADRTVVMPRGPATFTEATLSTLERKLAQHVGPIAHHLVQSAARRAGSLEELREIVAQRIDQPEQRSRFRQDLSADSRATSARPVAPALAQQGERELAVHLGPIARILVKRALEAAASPDDFWQRLASHIERDADRQTFLRKHRV
jgi:serine/threonine-protein kinase